MPMPERAAVAAANQIRESANQSSLDKAEQQIYEALVHRLETLPPTAFVRGVAMTATELIVLEHEIARYADAGVYDDREMYDFQTGRSLKALGLRAYPARMRIERRQAATFRPPCR